MDDPDDATPSDPTTSEPARSGAEPDPTSDGARHD
jgi:hypothetical protein